MEVIASKMKVLQIGGRGTDIGSDTYDNIPESCWIVPSLFIPVEVIWVTSIFYLHPNTAFFACWEGVCNVWAGCPSLSSQGLSGVVCGEADVYFTLVHWSKS